MATNDKLAAAAHFLISRVPPHQLGATKLNKMLWFADCEHFRRHGRSLTGEETYIRKQNGPCPVGIEGALIRLKGRRVITETLQPVMNYARREFVSLEEPALDTFTAEEVDILLQVAFRIANMTAQDASDLSHDDLWEGTDHNTSMSVEAGSVQFVPPTAEDLDWARRAFAAG